MAPRHFNEFQVALVAAGLMGLAVYSMKDKVKEGDQDTLLLLRHILRDVFEQEALKRILEAERTAVLGGTRPGETPQSRSSAKVYCFERSSSCRSNSPTRSISVEYPARSPCRSSCWARR